MALSLDKLADSLPALTLLGAAKASFGLGAGMLIGERLTPSVRRVTAWTCIGISIITGIPLVVATVVTIINRPGSSRSMRKRLESIRKDAGVSEGEEVI